jgi:hypothetical protein
MGYLGALLFAAFAGLRLAQVLAGDLLALPFFLQAALGAVLLVIRRPERGRARKPERILAWIVTVLPFGFQVHSFLPSGLAILSLAGLAFSLWGLITLGRSFGIAPADRGLVTRGPYRLVRHPMYAGELLSYAALVAAYPSAYNLTVCFGLACALALRILWEERALASYEAFKQHTRWAILPGIF